jgi:hypothetical protein
MSTEVIQFGLQHWNSEYKWWCPNGVPRDFVINGTKVIPPTHGTEWFETGVFPDWEKDKSGAFAFPAKKTDFLYSHDNICYTHLPDLAGKKYIFPIMIREISFFNAMEHTGFDFIHDNVFDDVRANRAKIVLLFPLEGTSGETANQRDYAILDSWCKKRGLNKDQVYYIHGNFKGPELSKGMDFTMIPINTFQCWVPGIRQHVPVYQPTDSKDLFLSYNRRVRAHRTILLCELIRSQLLGRGVVSYYGDNRKDSVERVKRYDRPGLEPEARLLDSLIPMEIDMNLGENNPAWNIVEDHYLRTFLSVVPETLYDNNVMFFSEKTWKTIAVGHPFILVSSPGMLKELRNQGFYTFGSWWDEGYDGIKSLHDRIRHIVLELKRLSAFSREELTNMRAAMQPVIEHNQRLFNTKWQENCSQHPERQLYHIVKDIWETF